VVYFSINDTENGKVLVPNDKMTIGGEESGTAKGPSLEGTKWKWTGFQSPVEDISVIEPDRYTLEFGENSSLRVQADCNKGAGTYTLDGSSLTFSPVATTRRACPDGSQDALFLKDLQWVRIVKVEGNDMYLDLFADGGTMKFTRVE
jgi:heat shock protein HslJ